MALTGTDRGSGNNNTAATTLTISPGSNFSGYSFGVLCIALDNAGSAGGTVAAPATATDSLGQIWTRRINPLFDNTAASAGVETACYTAWVAGFNTTDSLTLTWAAGVSPTAKAYTFAEFTSNTAWAGISYITGAAGTGGTSGVPTVTTGSITSGDVVIGWGGAESADTWAGDADATSGSWSTHQHNAAGTGTTGMSVTSQYKIVTATATQTYNPTLTSADEILGWIQIREAAGPTIIPLNMPHTPVVGPAIWPGWGNYV
jgi:hypothetical protein